MNVATTRTADVGDRLAVYSEAPVVRHGNWLNKVMDQATRDGRGLLLVTPPSSALSRGLLHVLDRTGGLWLVEPEGDGTHFLGRSGHSVHLGEDGSLEILDDPHPGWLREHVAEGRGGLLVQAETLHPRRPTTQVGGLMAAVSETTADAPPLGWGMQEPVTEPWDPREITRRFSRGEPFDALLHVAGPAGAHRLAGTLLIQRPRNGVVEQVQAAVERDGVSAGDELEETAAALFRAGVRWAAGQHTVGADPTLVPPYWLGAPVPAWLQFGPEALRQRDVGEVADFALSQGASASRVLGTGSGTGLAVFFPSSPGQAEEAGAHPLQAQRAILAHVLGADGSGQAV